MSRSCHFCFTINNYSEEEEIALQNLQTKFLCYGREVAPTTGTKHLQGYIQLHSRTRRGTVCKMLGNRAFVTECEGDFYQNIYYCTKDKNFFISDKEIEEAYELSKDVKLPDYWTKREVFDYRLLYNPECSLTVDQQIKQHDSFINFLLTQHPKLSRTQLIFQSEPLTDYETKNDNYHKH